MSCLWNTRLEQCIDATPDLTAAYPERTSAKVHAVAYALSEVAALPAANCVAPPSLGRCNLRR